MSSSVLLEGAVIPCRTLPEYVVLLLERLEESDPLAAARIREAVGNRSAIITLDDERIKVWFEGVQLRVLSMPESAADADGKGDVSRSTTLELLGGYLEVTAAVLDGRLDVLGTIEDIAAMGQAIEILIDGSARIPALQRLSRDFVEDPCRPLPTLPASGPVERQTNFYPDSPDPRERQLLARLNLLPQAGGRPDRS
jgi:hypothetical protein